MKFFLLHTVFVFAILSKEGSYCTHTVAKLTSPQLLKI